MKGLPKEISIDGYDFEQYGLINGKADYSAQVVWADSDHYEKPHDFWKSTFKQIEKSVNKLGFKIKDEQWGDKGHFYFSVVKA